MKRIPIDEAEVGHLRYHAEVILGMALGGRENIPTLRSKIAEAGWVQDHVLAEDAVPAAPSRSNGSSRFNTRPNVKDPSQSDVFITLNTSDQPGGDQPVFSAVNGVGIYIPRGEPCWVPEKYVEALNNAEELVYDDAGGEGGLGEPRRVKSYPFSYA